MKLLQKLAKELGISFRVLSKEGDEETGLLIAMEEGKKTALVSGDKVTRYLRGESHALTKQIMSILSAYKTDLWDELSDHQKNSVKEAKAELASGKGRSHKAVMKKYKKWLTK
jgi:hypothetical protein